jgi:hypothetical protein
LSSGEHEDDAPATRGWFESPHVQAEPGGSWPDPPARGAREPLLPWEVAQQAPGPDAGAPAPDGPATPPGWGMPSVAASPPVPSAVPRGPDAGSPGPASPASGNVASGSAASSPVPSAVPRGPDAGSPGPASPASGNVASGSAASGSAAAGQWGRSAEASSSWADVTRGGTPAGVATPDRDAAGAASPFAGARPAGYSAPGAAQDPQAWTPRAFRGSSAVGSPRSARATTPLGRIRDTAAMRAIRESGPYRKIRDTGAMRAIRDSGTMRAIRESGAMRAIRESGAMRAIMDTGAMRALMDTATMQMLQERYAGKGRVIAAVLVGAWLVVAVVAITLAFSLHSGGATASPAHPRASVAHPAAAKAGGATTGTARPLAAVKVIAWGPTGAGNAQHPEQVARAIDASMTTAWQTREYRTAEFPGAGLVLDMGKTVTVTGIRLKLTSGDASFFIRVGSRAVPGTLTRVASRTRSGGDLTITLAKPAQGRYVELWITRLPRDPTGSYQESVYSMRVTGRA